MKHRFLFFLLLIVMVGLRPSFTTAAPQTIITVDSLADEMVDDGNCTLREAIEAANTNTAVDDCRPGSPIFQDIITFRLDGTILLQDALVITQGVEIRGNGQNNTILDGAETAIPGHLIYANWIEGNPNVNLTHLTIQNAHSSSGPGGAISSGALVSLTLDHVTLRLNSGWNGGGLYTTGDVTIRHSQFLSNTAGSGGALYISFDGTASIEQSVFQGNSSQGNGGALYVGEGTALIAHSTFSHNRGESNLSDGGALYVNSSAVTITHSAIFNNYSGGSGGGLRLADSQATISNSTISGNSSAAHGGGLKVEINSTLEVRNSTIAANAPVGIVLAGSTAVFQDVIIGENEGQNYRTLHEGTIQSLGHNLVDFNGYDFYSCQLDQPTDIATEEGLFIRTLGPLQDNGGPTLTYALMPGSTAVDAGSCSSLHVADDQRGIARPQGAACDIGAFEGSFVTIYLPLINRDQ
jgi:CSLREA domain-containing protein